MTDIARELARIVGERHVLTGGMTEGYTTDWTGRFAGWTDAVVRPGSVDEVAAIVRWCAGRGVAVVPQGGNTGLVGGSIPTHGEVVMSLRRLDTLEAVDDDAGQVTVGAGSTLESVQRHVAASGFEFAVDLAARGSATIGGMAATNAGGTRVLRHGPMRAQVLGVEAVLGDGSIVRHLGGLLKDNTGYDLAALLCGSEGTLGIITRLRLRLIATAPSRCVAILGLSDVGAALACLRALRSEDVGLEAAEVFFADGVERVCAHLGITPPFSRSFPTYLLVECTGMTDPTDGVVAALAPLGDVVQATALATAAGRRADLWRYREAHTEAINALGTPHKLDVTLPLGALAAFCSAVRPAITAVAPGAITILFGHVGDGNIHVNVVDPIADVPDDVDRVVLEMVADFGGSISAEHGIGTAKVAYLHLSRTDAERSAFRRIKAALDPSGILNPHVLLPPPTLPD